MKKQLLIVITLMILGSIFPVIHAYGQVNNVDFKHYSLTLPADWEELPYSPYIEDINIELKYSSSEYIKDYKIGYFKNSKYYPPNSLSEILQGRDIPKEFLETNRSLEKIESAYFLIQQFHISDIYIEDVYKDLRRNKDNIYGLKFLRNESISLYRDDNSIIVDTYGVDQPTYTALFLGKDLVTQLDYYSVGMENIKEDEKDFYKIVESFSYDNNYRYDKSEKSLFDFHSYLPMIRFFLIITFIMLIGWRTINYFKKRRASNSGKIISKKIENEKTSPREKKEKVKEPLWRFALLSIITLGIYELIWMYKNWRILKRELNLDVEPLFRALFSPVYIYRFSLRVEDLCKKEGIKTNKYSEALVVSSIYIFFSFSVNFPGYTPLLVLFTFLPLLPLVKLMNQYWSKKDSNKKPLS